MKKHGIRFLSFTFLLTYICHGALAILSQRGIIQLTDFLGQLLFILGGSSPTIMAFVVAHLFYNEDERRSFYQRLVNFKQPAALYFFALFAPIILGLIFLLIATLFGYPFFEQLQSPLQYFIFLFSAFLFGGLEEVGWRGILQNQFTKKIHPLILAIVIGLIWSFWHLPMFFVPGLSHSSYAVIPFILQGIVFSLFQTFLFAKSKSIPMVVLFHTSINAAASIGLRLTFENRLYVYLYLLIAFILGALLLRDIGSKRGESDPADMSN